MWGVVPGYTRSGKTVEHLSSPSTNKNPSSPSASASIKQYADPNPSSKTKRSSADDGLTKRIAKELMRGKRYPEAAVDQPIFIQPEGTRTGPVFVTQPSISKEANSIASSPQPTEKITTNPVTPKIGLKSRAIGITLACFAIALIYITTWIFLYSLELGYTNSRNASLYPEDSGIVTLNMKWVASCSILILIAIPYWWLQPRTYYHLLTSLHMVVASAIILSVSIIYRMIVGIELPAKQPLMHHQVFEDDSINYWLPAVFMILHVLTINLMLNSFGGFLRKQIFEKSRRREENQIRSDHTISHLLSPRSRIVRSSVTSNSSNPTRSRSNEISQ